MTPQQLAALIDHTLLKPDATPDQIRMLCREAREYGFFAVCVNPCHVTLCRRELADSKVVVCTVAGFPLGATTPEVKAHEARQALHGGAREIDMVLNLGALRAGHDREVVQDVQAVAEVCHGEGAALKVILETALLDDAQIRRACRLALEARADWVKTSTGFGPGGATEEAVRLMVQEVHPHGLRVKASGGIRTLRDAQNMIEAGAQRLGTSGGVKLLEELTHR